MRRTRVSFRRKALLYGLAAVAVLSSQLVSIAPAPTASATRPGGNGRILFTSFRDGNAEIYVMNADGTGQTRITNNTYPDYAGRWSPDGTKILFVSDRDGDAEIFVMNANGTGQTQITHNSASDAAPDWSPDGTKIVFSSKMDGDPDIYVMNADGTGLTQIVNEPLSDFAPTWSPDGTKIAYSGDIASGSGTWEIYTLNPDGTNRVNVSNTPTQVEFDTSWSPDGTKIAVTADRDLHKEIWSLDVDGSGSAKVTDMNDFTVGPAWSPDGTKIAFTSYKDGDGDIYVINTDGSGLVQLTNSPEEDYGPDWLPIASAPVSPLAIPGDGRARVVWQPPAIHGAVPINAYKVTAHPGGATTMVNADMHQADVTGLTNGTTYYFTVNAITSGGTGPAGTSNSITPGATAGDSDTRYITAAYVDFLRRLPDAGGMSYWHSYLAGGGGRPGFTTSLANSHEWLTGIVDDLYYATLDRPGDPGGLAYWTGRIASGAMSVTDVAAQFYASDEAYSIAGATPADPRPWITDLYREILHRTPDAGGLAYWTSQTAALGRVAVARSFYQSPESRQSRVTRLYLQLLGRAPDAGGLAYWAEQILHTDDVALAINLSVSDEYYARAQTRF